MDGFRVFGVHSPNGDGNYIRIIVPNDPKPWPITSSDYQECPLAIIIDILTEKADASPLARMNLANQIIERAQELWGLPPRL